jgi:hypothetical protein
MSRQYQPIGYTPASNNSCPGTSTQPQTEYYSRRSDAQDQRQHARQDYHSSPTNETMIKRQDKGDSIRSPTEQLSVYRHDRQFDSKDGNQHSDYRPSVKDKSTVFNRYDDERTAYASPPTHSERRVESLQVSSPQTSHQEQQRVQQSTTVQTHQYRLQRTE